MGPRAMVIWRPESPRLIRRLGLLGSFDSFLDLVAVADVASLIGWRSASINRWGLQINYRCSGDAAQQPPGSKALSRGERQGNFKGSGF